MRGGRACRIGTALGKALLYQCVSGQLTALTTHRATLDDVFLAMTGRALREE